MTLIYPRFCAAGQAPFVAVIAPVHAKTISEFNRENSLFQQAAQRVSGSQFANPLVLTSNEYRFIAAQQLTDIGVEPNGLMLSRQKTRLSDVGGG